MAQSILVVSHHTELVEKLRKALDGAGAPDILLDHAPSSVLAGQILAADPTAIHGVVVDLNDKSDAIALIEHLQEGRIDVPIYAAALNGTVHFDAQAAVQAGARRIFQRADDFPKLLAEHRTLSRIAAKKAQLVLFAPAQDGAGASTAALHTAGILANDFQTHTLLTEIDYYSDSVAYRLRLSKAPSLSDLTPQQTWRQAVSEWQGLQLLAAPTSSRTLRTRGLPEVALAIGEACHEYQFVIGDLPCNTAVVSPEILAGADRVYVVATAEVTSLYLARRRLLNLVTAGAKTEAVRLIINRDRAGAVDNDMARQVTGLQPAHRLPNDFAAASAAETEAALVARSSPLGRAYTQLAADIAGKAAQAPAPPSRGWGRFLAALR